ncbi:Tyrosine-protein phosphatase [Pleurostoma richardsiae]|uniref:Tyrosine-protein phosphatase n=1 Tax=Pleurostoma richardsiae TaxID=41990 RepID=A0AA38RP40_9PEZI|nr:Tyrosine-protein phosphatase [Pleurostoma richardsiae]
MTVLKSQEALTKDADGAEVSLSGNRADRDAFERILNFRDVGATVNTFLGRKLVRESLLYRSARPDEATPADRRLLRDGLGVRAVIDLRTHTEHLSKEERRRADPAAAAAGEPLQIPGVRYLEIKVTGRAFERFLLSQLGWISFLRFLFLFVLGYRMPAVSIIGREVMRPRGLLGLGTDTLDQSGAEIAEALTALLDPSSLPAVIHCTQGKDRTGLLAALVLLALGPGAVPLPAIEHDYRLTDAALARQESPRERAARIAEIREIGLPDDFGGTVPGFVRGLAAHLEGRYGGVEAYLDGIGFGEGQRGRLRERFLY